MPMRSWAVPLLASGMLASAAPAPAQTESAETAPEPRRYNVEIILFRYADSMPSGNEQFVADPPPADAATQDELDALISDDEIDDVPAFGDHAVGATPAGPADSGSDDVAEVILPARRVDLAITAREALTLQAQYDKLQLLDAYEPLMWTGWTQTALERDVSPRIPLRRLGNAPAGFDGELQLYLSRFLHLVVDLTLTPRHRRGSPDAFVPSFGDGRSSIEPAYDPGVVQLRISEDRIFRNGDLRYFDHPKFGLLARVTRVEEPDPLQPEGADYSGEVLPAGQEVL